MARRKHSSRRKTVLSLAQAGPSPAPPPQGPTGPAPARAPTLPQPRAPTPATPARAGPTPAAGAAAAAATPAAAAGVPDPAYAGGLPVQHRHAAGIDIGSFSHWVCVDAAAAVLQEFAAHTDGLHQIVAYLRGHQIRTVAMEATGIYWIPLYELLEAEGFEVLLVDPSFTKPVQGRPKTDKHDCRWIPRLHAHGLRAAAFRPDEKTCVLRNYLRQRATHVRYAGQHILHMQKALEQMNVKLPEVVSASTGVTGLTIIKAILRGERDPLELAKHRDRRCKNKEATLAQALNGSYRDEHLFALEQALAGWEFYQNQLTAVDEHIRQQLHVLKKHPELPPLPPKARLRKRKRNEPGFDVRLALYYVTGVDLTEIEGIDTLTALVLVSEIGTDMSRWPTVKHFASWLGLCPQLRKSGGHVKSSRTRPGVNRAAAALQLGASALHRSGSALGAFYRRMKSRLGAAKAVTATAHKLARIVYHTLKEGRAYVQRTQADYEAHLRARQVQNLKRKAKELGLEIVELAATANAAETAGAGT